MIRTYEKNTNVYRANPNGVRPTLVFYPSWYAPRPYSPDLLPRVV